MPCIQLYPDIMNQPWYMQYLSEPPIYTVYSSIPRCHEPTLQYTISIWTSYLYSVFKYTQISWTNPAVYLIFLFFLSIPYIKVYLDIMNQPWNIQYLSEPPIYIVYSSIPRYHEPTLQHTISIFTSYLYRIFKYTQISWTNLVVYNIYLFLLYLYSVFKYT